MTEGGDLDKLGRGYLWNGQIPNCLHQNHIFAVRCFPHKLRPVFLAYATASKYGRDYFEATGKRTTNLACTNATKVGLFPIPLQSLRRAGYGEEIVAALGRQLEAEFGRGFGEKNLRRMVQFAEVFPDKAIVVSLLRHWSRPYPAWPRLPA